jgi:hypothetical protein
MTASEVGIHNVEVCTEIDAQPVCYTFPLMIDEVQGSVSATTLAGDTIEIRGTQDWAMRVAATCFPDYSSAAVDAVVPGSPYAVERNVSDDGATEVQRAADCVKTSSVATTEEAPLLVNYIYSEGNLPSERLEPVDPADVSLIQVKFE